MSRTLRALILMCGLIAGPALGGPTVQRLLVRIVTGAEGAPAGAYVELRIREAGRQDRRLPLAGDAPWPAGSTRTVPISLGEPLDPDAVARFSVYYRAPPSAASASWEIARADVYAVSADGHERPLAAAIQGLIRREGEIASAERAASSLMCVTDADCDDGRACNGRERCDPTAGNANARGCVRGSPVICPKNQVCMERFGCRGADTGDTANPPIATASGEPPSAVGRAAAGEPSAAPGVAVQTCNGHDVLLTDASGATRRAPCPQGTSCVAQPNGTGVCAPSR